MLWVLLAPAAAEKAREDNKGYGAALLIKVLVAVAVAALPVLAFFGDSRALTFDEIYSVNVAGQNAAAIVRDAASDIHPPLYYLVLAMWIRLFGTGELAVRSLSGLIYLACVGSIYGLARSFWDGRTSLACALAFMMAPVALLHAQYARMYMLAALFSILSTWLFARLVFGPSGRMRWVLYVLVNVLGTFTHVWFFFLLLAEMVTFWVFAPRRRWTWFAVAGASSVIPYAVLWMPVLLRQYQTARYGLAWLGSPTLLQLLSLAAWLGGGIGGALVVLLALTVFRNDDAANLHGAFAAAVRYREEPVALFVAMFLITLAVPFALSFKKPIFHVRYTIVAAHLIALAVGWFFAQLAGNKVLFAAGVVTLAAVLLATIYIGVAPDSCSDRAIAIYIAQNAGPGDVIVYTELSRLPVEFYLNRLNRHFSSLSFPHNDAYDRQGFLDKSKFDLNDEARRIVARIKLPDTSPGRLIWVLGGSDASLDRTLKQQLDTRFDLQKQVRFQCRRKLRGFALYDTLMIYGSPASTSRE